MTKRDIIIICIVLIGGSVIGWGLKSCMVKPSVPEIFNDVKYVRAEDSLKSLINASKDSISIYKKHILYTDSLVIINRKNLRYDNEIIKNFTPSGRQRYLDSLFKSAGI
jgi:hypothetical protein